MNQPLSRRVFLGSAALFLMTAGPARARLISGGMPWQAGGAVPPQSWRPGPWLFFTGEEAEMVEAIVDRLIPPDELGPGGKDAGCAVFIDRQLAGPYGGAAGLYMSPPFAAGSMTQGNQSAEAPAMRYRQGLGALANHVRSAFSGKKLADLSAQQQDEVLKALESGKIDLKTLNGGEFFNLLLQNTMEGYFADPIYGGNREMVGWKLVGFPGTRYDYRDWVDRHNEPYPLPPVAIMGRPDWSL
jgi:gluconate 2-dehydrogenase gamma chain